MEEEFFFELKDQIVQAISSRTYISCLLLGFRIAESTWQGWLWKGLPGAQTHR